MQLAIAAFPHSPMDDGLIGHGDDRLDLGFAGMGSEFDYARITPDEATWLVDKGRLAWDWSPRQESNLHLALRRHLFYPLNYGEMDIFNG